MAQQSRVGDLLAGRYRLDALLGSGGVGDVYRAQNTLIGRTVAIKLLKPEHATDDSVVERFLREAKAANLARHPNVVDVLDVGLDDEGIPFIVQEFLEGMDLGSHLKRVGGPLPSKQVLDLLIPVVEAVGLAHTRGVVHRDLKPENVFLAKADGKVVPKLLDFGISYIKPQPGDVRMTKTGITVGTPAYMSPEQLEGTAGVDARTDVWALGVILYEALAGRLPFEGETSALLFAQIAWVDPMPLRDVAPHVPERLAQVVNRCLRRKLQERYPSAAELTRDLVHVREGRPIEPTQHRAAVTPAFAAGPASSSVSSSRIRAIPAASLNGGPRSEVGDGPISSRRPGLPVPKPDIVPVAEPIEPPVRSKRSGISLATIPPPKAEAHVSAPPETGVVELAPRLIAFAVAGLLTAGVWMTVLHHPEGWPAHSWILSAVGGVRTLGALIVSLASVAAGVWVVIRFYQLQPRVWGRLVTSLGLFTLAVPVGMAWLGTGPETGAPPSLWGWGVALAIAGFGMSGAQQAWSSWERGDSSGKVLGAVLIVAATSAILIGFEVLRALA